VNLSFVKEIVDPHRSLNDPEVGEVFKIHGRNYSQPGD